jgi:hypothetical protein
VKTYNNTFSIFVFKYFSRLVRENEMKKKSKRMFFQLIFFIGVSFFSIYIAHQGWLFIRDKFSRKIPNNLYSSQIHKYQSLLEEKYAKYEEKYEDNSEELLRLAETF